MTVPVGCWAGCCVLCDKCCIGKPDVDWSLWCRSCQRRLRSNTLVRPGVWLADVRMGVGRFQVKSVAWGLGLLDQELGEIN